MISFHKEYFEMKGITVLYETDNMAENIGYIFNAYNNILKDKDLISCISKKDYRKYKMYISNSLFYILNNNKSDILQHGHISLLIDKSHPRFNNDLNVITDILTIFSKSYIMYPTKNNNDLYKFESNITIIESPDRNNMIIDMNLSILVMILYRDGILTKKQSEVFRLYILDTLLNTLNSAILKNFIKVILYNDKFDIENFEISDELIDFYNAFSNRTKEFHGITSLGLYAAPLLYDAIRFIDDINYLYKYMRYNHNFNGSNISFIKEDINSIIYLTYMISAPLIINLNIHKHLEGNINYTLVEPIEISMYNFTHDDNSKYYLELCNQAISEHANYVKDAYNIFKQHKPNISNNLMLPQAVNYDMFITASLSSYINLIKKCRNNLSYKEELRDIAKCIDNTLIVYNVLYN